MDSPRKHIPLWLLPNSTAGPIPNLTTRRPILAGVVSAVLLVALIPMYVFIAPESIWTPQALFAILFGLGFASAAAAMQVRRFLSADAAATSIALVSLALLGPLPAACVLAAGEVILLSDGRSGRRIVPLLSNLALCGWSTLAAGMVLHALTGSATAHIEGPAAYAALALAGLTGVLVWYALYPIGSTLFDGARIKTVIRSEITPSFVSDCALLPVALATVFLYDVAGLIGLLPLAAITVLQGALAQHVFRRRDAASLGLPQATALYASTIAATLRLEKARRLWLDDAAHQVGGDAQLQNVSDFNGVMRTVLYTQERFDGAEGSFPGVLSGDQIPIESRVLAVARCWAQLTTAGGAHLSHEQALAQIRARAGAEFDPTVVAAAVKATEDDVLPVQAPEATRAVQPSLAS